MKIRYFCHAGQETGYGRAATELALALVEAGVDLDLVPLNTPWSFEGPAERLRACVKRSWPSAEYGGAYDATIVHTMPLDCWEPRAACADAREVEGDGPWIAYTTWEGVDVPGEITFSLADAFDDIWVPSTATRDAFQGDEDAPFATFVLPHTYDAAALESYKHYLSTTTHWHRSDKEPCQFRYVGAWTTRKNPHGLIRAFARAFTRADRVELVIHSPGVSIEMFTAALVATGLEQRDAPIIRLSSEKWSSEAMRASHQSYDCFVTATRGESWNLPAFEAMLAGRMVIAPGNMGHDDFLFEDPDGNPTWDAHGLTSARWVPGHQQPAFVDVETVEEVTVGGFEIESRRRGLQFRTVGAQGLTSRTAWLDPSLNALGDEMRRVFEAKQRDIELYYKPADRFSHAVVAKQAIERIDYLIHAKEG